MKCPKCDGKGMVDYPMYADDEHKWQYCVARMKKCDMCNGTGEVEMTNEEWFCQLSTEEKATFLAIQIRLGVEFYRTNDERYQNHDWWVEWLKEKHHAE